MNKQEVFDKVATHLLRQGRRSTSEHGMCKYRSEDGAMCAVGCLIPDHLYDTSIEGLNVEDIVNLDSRISQALGVQSRQDVEFLDCIQVIHDNVFVEYWPKHLRSLARDFSLDPSIIDHLGETS